MEVAKITSKGQITIPISIRRKLDINEGDKVLFIYKPDGVLMVNPNTFQGAHTGDVVDVAETEMAAEAVAAAKKREKAKAGGAAGVGGVGDAAGVGGGAAGVGGGAAGVGGAVGGAGGAGVGDESAATDMAVEGAAYKPAQEVVSRPVPPPVEEPEKPSAQIGGLNLGSLLDDIRSIGSNI